MSHLSRDIPHNDVIIIIIIIIIFLPSVSIIPRGLKINLKSILKTVISIIITIIIDNVSVLLCVCIPYLVS